MGTSAASAIGEGGRELDGIRIVDEIATGSPLQLSKNTLSSERCGGTAVLSSCDDVSEKYPNGGIDTHLERMSLCTR